MDDTFVAWPFVVVEPATGWSERHRDFLNFMRIAYAKGFGPSHRHESAIGAKSKFGREIFLIFRGFRNGWEPCLKDGDLHFKLGPTYSRPAQTAIFVAPPFRNTAHLALQWLRGYTLEAVLHDFLFDGKRTLNRRLDTVVPTGGD